jgi:hypothetical protein
MLGRRIMDDREWQKYFLLPLNLPPPFLCVAAGWECTEFCATQCVGACILPISFPGLLKAFYCWLIKEEEEPKIGLFLSAHPAFHFHPVVRGYTNFVKGVFA